MGWRQVRLAPDWRPGYEFTLRCVFRVAQPYKTKKPRGTEALYSKVLQFLQAKIRSVFALFSERITDGFILDFALSAHLVGRVVASKPFRFLRRNSS